MNKKFLSAILFGALMVSSTGTFVSCKDYDDDIDNINKELSTLKGDLSALQAKVNEGKPVTVFTDIRRYTSNTSFASLTNSLILGLYIILIPETVSTNLPFHSISFQ